MFDILPKITPHIKGLKLGARFFYLPDPSTGKSQTSSPIYSLVSRNCLGFSCGVGWFVSDGKSYTCPLLWKIFKCRNKTWNIKLTSNFQRNSVCLYVCTFPMVLPIYILIRLYLPFLLNVLKTSFHVNKYIATSLFIIE